MLPILKADKKEFGYVDAKTSNPICGKCKYFVQGGKCLLVQGEISGVNGSCTLWVKGNPRIYPFKSPPLTKKESGYIEYPKGPKCGVCVFYSDPRGCYLVKGDIEPETGCCNAWKGK
jgi:hypothetical protein